MAGFRGPNRDSTIKSVGIATDWATSPPAELWRRPIGPGWSSFAVGGEYIYTQEQRGEDEVVSCYRLSTGAPVWRHRDAARFYETIGGPGPRATPTIHQGRIYTHGATGIVNALDAATGARIWTRNSVTDTGAVDPGWGFTSSPLVFADTVIVAASGVLVAYDTASGEPRWKGPEGGAGYSSPHLATLDHVPQLLLLRGSRTTSVNPADGTLLWEHRWLPSASIVQPAVIGDRDVLINSSDTMGGQGLRRLAIARGSAGPSTGAGPSGATSEGGWTVEERWTSRGLKPVLQRLRRSQRARLRLRRQHPRVHRSRDRRAEVEGRPLRLRTDAPAGQSGRAARAVRGRRCGAGARGAGQVHGDRAGQSD